MGRIVHIVLWKLKAAPAGVDAASHASSVKAGISKLLQVPGPVEGHLGEPKIEDRAKGFNYGFYSIFESMDALKTYAVSDAHMKVVVEEVRPNVEDVLAYDFELSD